MSGTSPRTQGIKGMHLQSFALIWERKQGLNQYPQVNMGYRKLKDYSLIARSIQAWDEKNRISEGSDRCTLSEAWEILASIIIYYRINWREPVATLTLK